MKHNIKIKDDALVLKVTLEKLTPGQDRTRLGMPSVIKLLSEFKLPAGVSLGRCITPTLGLDNSFDDMREGTWVFELLNKKSAPKKSAPKKSTPSRKK